ncbi:MAG: ZIP family metal transporter [Clostridiales bacterium]|nr:ZIP family metal transporter [Clostridiales bacterium]
MSNLLYSTIVGASAGIIGTGLGGAIAFILDKPGKRFLSVLLSFSAGLMIAVVCFDLLPEAFEMGSLFYGLLGLALGVVAIVFCEELINRYMSARAGWYPSNRYIETGILLGIGIALHNLPEGLAIGSGFTARMSYGWELALIISLHDIPEGIAMVTPMIIGGAGPFKAFISALIAGIPTGIGAMIGYLLGEISPVLISLCLGFAGGAMLYITCSELIPESRELHKGRVSSLGLILGVIAGIAITSTL